MPQNFNPGSGQDWAAVNVGSGGASKKPTTAREVDRAKAMGLVVTEKKYGAGGNKSAHAATALSAKKLEEADDVGVIAKVDKSLSKAIQQGESNVGSIIGAMPPSLFRCCPHCRNPHHHYYSFLFYHYLSKTTSSHGQGHDTKGLGDGH